MACSSRTIIATFAILLLTSSPISSAPAAQSLQSRISKPDPKKYQAIQDAKDWKNPFLVVHRDGIEILGVTPDGHSIPVGSVPQILDRLPDFAWPYGLVVAVQDNGVSAQGDSPRIKANREKLLALLRELGVTTELWPSA